MAVPFSQRAPIVTAAAETNTVTLYAPSGNLAPVLFYASIETGVSAQNDGIELGFIDNGNFIRVCQLIPVSSRREWTGMRITGPDGAGVAMRYDHSGAGTSSILFNGQFE